MDSVIDKLERKYSRFAIEDLTKKLLILKVIVFLCIQFLYQGSAEKYVFALNKIQVANTHIIGDLIAGICTPPVSSASGFGIIWIYFALSIFLMAGRSLEAAWGTFRYNLYILSYVTILLASCTFVRLVANVNPITGMDFLYISVFLAFATKFPNVEFMLFFIIPAKVKYLAWLIGGVTAFTAIAPANFFAFLIYGTPLIHYAVYILPVLKTNAKLKKKQEAFIKKTDPKQGRATFHECATCGLTENDDPEMLFRVGDDGKDYCEKHI